MKNYRVYHLAPHWFGGMTEYKSASMTLADATERMQEMAKKNIHVWIKKEQA